MMKMKFEYIPFTLWFGEETQKSEIEEKKWFVCKSHAQVCAHMDIII